MPIWDLLDPTVRTVRGYARGLVPAVNALEEEMSGRSDDQLRSYMAELRQEHDNGASLDDIMVRCFAGLREVSKRTIGLRPHDVQLVGAAVLHTGNIAEMKTGEGKTLVAALTLTLNALSGKGAHLVTPNDYLARRDADWKRPIYEYCGLSVGCIQHDLNAAQRKEAYNCDITYGTNNEIGFDYLRDNMQRVRERLVLRHLNFAIVDEVDSILVDEARTPLIISGFKAESSDLYRTADRAVRQLVRGEDYTVEERERQVMLTDEGTEKVERILGVENLGDPENLEWVHHINTALRAHSLFQRDINYVVRDGQVVIVDEFTGRLMFGRRYGEGLHQAIEAKENVRVEHESQTLATITLQNFFRLYDKLAGMTGTAKTEEPEFIRIYGTPVAVVPTNKPVVRADHPDVVYKTEEAKFRGICQEILSAHLRGQPSLVGTRSIEVSERLASRLEAAPLQRLALATVFLDKVQNHAKEVGEKAGEFEEILHNPLDELKEGHLRTMSRAVGYKADGLDEDVIQRFAELLDIPELKAELGKALSDGVPHNVLNAKYHEREAQIVADAGRVGAVTIATNMAGRGTDIQLGGKPPEGMKVAPDYEKVKAAGGLHILGTERHESRRIDNQLRGRSGRQGDPGSSRFYLSLEDELWRLFGAQDRMQGLQKGWRENERIENRLLSRLIENAQKRVENHHFEIRKHVLKYDDVMNRQREAIYAARRRVLEGDDFGEQVREFVQTSVALKVADHVSPDQGSGSRTYAELIDNLRQHVPIDDLYDLSETDLAQVPLKELRETLYRAAKEEKVDSAGLSEISAVVRELHLEEARFEELLRDLRTVFPVDAVMDPDELFGAPYEEIEAGFVDGAMRAYEAKEEEFGPEEMRSLERMCMLTVVDELWIDHLAAMDGLRDGIQLRAHAQIDPLVAYQKEAYDMWETLQEMIREEVVRRMFRAQAVTVSEESMYQIQSEGRGSVPLIPTRSGAAVTSEGESVLPGQSSKPKPVVKGDRPGRNDPCPCGSGKKYKKCCMDKDERASAAG
ncbi:MAG: DEAD/DEAH box helicase [Armatimonadia bacterium]|nr:DEAD/DEAH box helicase [Armatimonadia bacterium]